MVLFKCAKCGNDTYLAAQNPNETVCTECCEDHQYEYDSATEWPCCIHCAELAPHDYYDESDNLDAV